MQILLNFFKNNTAMALAIVLMAIVAISQTYLVVRAQESTQENSDSNQINEQNSAATAMGSDLGNAPYDPQFFPHANCLQKLVYTEEPSSVYNPDDPYNLSFFSGQQFSGFIDINGDNLPDYVRASSTINGGSNLFQEYEGCVYLNNGEGWTQAYVCRAVTEFNTSSETITRAEYWGDCAGEPSTKE